MKTRDQWMVHFKHACLATIRNPSNTRAWVDLELASFVMMYLHKVDVTGMDEDVKASVADVFDAAGFPRLPEVPPAQPGRGWGSSHKVS